MKRLLLIGVLLLAASSATLAAEGKRISVDRDGLQHWIGISTDTKPSASSLPPGSTFIETDTKQRYVVGDDGTWVSLGELVYLTSLLAGEDETNDVIKVEGQFLYKVIPHTDTQVKATAGFLHSFTCTSDAAATAGTIILYDSTTETGAVIHTYTFAAAWTHFNDVWDVAFDNGLYVGYTTTADVDCTVSYR